MNENDKIAIKNIGENDPNGYVYEGLDLDKHWESINELMNKEEWPYIRADLEVSHQQPEALGVVTLKEGMVVGFMTMHGFSNIGYLDMIIVDKDHRKYFTFSALKWAEILRNLWENKFEGQVAHCTNDSQHIAAGLGFKPGLEYGLLRKDSINRDLATNKLNLLNHSHLNQIADLDQQVFGIYRPEWIASLLSQPTSYFVGGYEAGKLVATVCIRKRKDNIVCLDSCNSLSSRALFSLLAEVLENITDSHLECFVKLDSELFSFLESNDFYTPDFFKEIGPLVEMRKGETGNVGLSEHMCSLSWI